jgi:hypothetical protein
MRLLLPVRLRRTAARRPFTIWIAAAALTIVAGASVHGALAALDDQRQSWGTTTSVWLAARDLAAGDPVAGGIERHTVPAAMVPSDALEIDGDPSSATLARQHIGTGEIVTELDVTAPDGRDTMSPHGWVTVAIREPIPTGASVGRSVTISADGAVLAPDATVVGQRDDAVLVAVPAADGPAVAAAASESRAALLVRD